MSLRTPTLVRRQRGQRLDRYGVVAVVVAAGGLAAVFGLQARSSVESPARQAQVPEQSVQVAVVPAAPPVRDQWYLDTRQAAPLTSAAAVSPVRDQWYLDVPRSVAPASAPPARDQWYMNETHSVAPPVRDQWYLDGR